MTPIEHIRTKVLGITQAEMASLAGVNQATVSRWEAGRLNIDVAAMERIRARASEKDGWSDALFFVVPSMADQPASAA